MLESDNVILYFFAAGILLFIVEMLTLSFYAFFLSIGSFIVALCLYLGFSFSISLSVGALLSLLCSVIFQRIFQKKTVPARIEQSPFTHLIGGTGMLVEGISSKESYGTVVVDGTAWRAMASCPLEKGIEVMITAIDSENSMTVIVKRLNTLNKECTV